MKPRRDIPLPPVVDEFDDDTDEIELSPEQARALSLAGNADDPESSTAEVSVIPAADLPQQQSSPGGSKSSDRWPRLHVGQFLGIAVALIVVGGLWRFAATRNPPAALVAANPSHRDGAAPTTQPAAAVTPNPGMPLPTSPPVRIRNAFDRSEVFEFPPGTSQVEARAAVADILLQRARERQ